MTTLHVIDGHEDRNAAVARRLREKLAGINMSRRELSRRVGEAHTWATSRAAGKTALTVSDLERIEQATGISADYLFSGIENAPRPGGPGGGWRATRDSNPQPSDPKVRQSTHNPNLRMVA